MSLSEHPTTSSSTLARTARLALAVVVLVFLAGCSDDDEPIPGDPSDTGVRPGSSALSATTDPTGSTTPLTPTPAAPTTDAPSAPSTATTPPESEPEPELVVYVGGEAVAPFITSSLDVGRLRGAPADFKDFIGREADKIGQETTCADGAVGITVDAVRSDGFAVGAVNDCGGYAAMWAKDQGEWLLIQGTQDSWDCGILELYSVPSDLLLGDPTCFDYDGDKQAHPYPR